MKTHGYSAAELASFYAVLDRAVREAAERDFDLTVAMMVRRLFNAAADGERDPEALMRAIFPQQNMARRAAA